MPTALIREDMRRFHNASDASVIARLTKNYAPNRSTRTRITERARRLVDQVRTDTKPGMTEAFLSEYGLTSDEGVAVMTLAEALLRVPDADTQDALIEDKTTGRHWMDHAGKSDNRIVNLSTLALSLTGHVLADVEDDGVSGVLRIASKRLGAPVIRAAVGRVMRELGHQFVLGETIADAMTRARAQEAKGYTYSYDMLGEAALTAADARTFYTAYEAAIHHIGKSASGDSVATRAGISVKLSALHPRYEFLKGAAVIQELADKLAKLANLAASYNIGLNVDAEEADRLDISLDIIEAALLQTPAHWEGFGVVVQAYGKRASWVIDWLYTQAQEQDRRLMVRLVKGAYWDTEIKLAQVQGLDGYPVFCTKAATDMSYICCAAKLLGMRDRIYPQFATHNAHTVAAVMEIGGNQGDFEFQRLHGMGEALHDVNRAETKAPTRIYAPVGSHKELLAYLVRRLLENGANSSFVNQIVNADIPSDVVVADPFDSLDQVRSGETPITPPNALFLPERCNSTGLNVQNRIDVETLETARAPYLTVSWDAHPLTAVPWTSQETDQITNPANCADLVGRVQNADARTVKAALEAASPWSADLRTRQCTLNRIADLYEDHKAQFAALLAREAGKTLLDVEAEVREAVDFLRYYAAQAAHHPGTHAMGLVAAISPWNFPLAIFTGQISAALSVGNAVVAKPAEQSPLTAFLAVDLMHQAGVPPDALQLLPGHGATVGAALTSHPNVDTVCFTGSTATAQAINRTMARHLHPDASLLAETGGLNAMIVDSTALPEQAVKDIIASAFQSAGQRCSALRVLYVQEDIADPFLTMLTGAMEELTVGDPLLRATDVGPVIDAPAKAVIEEHIRAHKGRIIKQIDAPEFGTFVAPTLIEIDGIGDLEAEIFGPVLHICRFKSVDLARVIEDINATGYALTFGLHTRIEGRAEAVAQAVNAGNVYINRNQIGAVVGSQPFGGEGLSGTGPKAGGPRYLTRFLRGSGTPPVSEHTGPTCTVLPGPTGEQNTLITSGRGTILCLGPEADRDVQRAIAKANGAGVMVGDLSTLQPDDLLHVEGVAYWGDKDSKRRLRIMMADRPGPILPLLASEYDMCNFVREQHVCIDTTAAGGNAALLAQA